MSRSTHTTRGDLKRLEQWDCSDADLKAGWIEDTDRELRHKSRVKWQVRRERRRAPEQALRSAADTVPIQVDDRSPHVHYPASEHDLREVARRLPGGVLDGLRQVRLCLGSEEQWEAVREAPCRVRPDPWTGRYSREGLPGTWGGVVRGTYSTCTQTLQLYAWVYRSDLPNCEVWELYLRLQMCSTFLHEAAHHHDQSCRTARGRWLAESLGEREAYAEEMAERWVCQAVLPYLEEAYPDQLRAFSRWVEDHVGVPLSLPLLAGCWYSSPSDTRSLISKAIFPMAPDFERFVRSVYRRGDLVRARVDLARGLHHAEYDDEALAVLARVLSDSASDPEARALQARILCDLGRHEAALDSAAQVATEHPQHLEAWLVVADVHKAREEWPETLAATLRALECARPGTWEQRTALQRQVQAHLALRQLPEAIRAFEALCRLDSGRLAHRRRRLRDTILARMHDQGAPEPPAPPVKPPTAREVLRFRDWMEASTR